MTRDEALKNCQAYLDKQLEPHVAAEIEKLLASDPVCAQAFENQRNFHGLIERCSGNVKPSEDFQQRLRNRLSTQRSAPVKAPIQRPRFRWVRYCSAAGVVLAAGVAIVVFAWPAECPYMVACASEHSLVMEGQAHYEIESGKNADLTQFVAQQTAAHIEKLPDLLPQLKPHGAGVARFETLKGAPKGVFIRYDGVGEPVTMLIHPWPEETPYQMNLREYKGLQYWAAQHHGFSIACWKSIDGKLLCSLISKRPKEELLAIASGARAILGDLAKPNIIARPSSKRLAYIFWMKFERFDWMAIQE